MQLVGGREGRLGGGRGARKTNPQVSFITSGDRNSLVMMKNLHFVQHLCNEIISIQGNSGPMVLHKCLALDTCIRSKSN